MSCHIMTLMIGWLRYFFRLLTKVAYAEEFEGDAERRTAAYLKYVRIRVPHRRTNYQQK
ncbi:palindromic element RPE1 domain-containing protein [Candidatus Tisiphia endosymbiont of Dascillus cervinus]|uniref:palindromic element RPE1 domain-containing protein n=1 Tax=Candidatus Tisiphia endosymbiont of Dascillus cervinus TaxID=3066253 RepID=UPI0039778BD2